MTFITKTVVDLILRDEIDLPNPNRMNIDDFNAVTCPIIQKRFINLDEDHVEKVSKRIWNIKNGGLIA